MNLGEQLRAANRNNDQYEIVERLPELTDEETRAVVRFIQNTIQVRGRGSVRAAFVPCSEAPTIIPDVGLAAQKDPYA